MLGRSLIRKKNNIYVLAVPIDQVGSRQKTDGFKYNLKL